MSYFRFEIEFRFFTEDSSLIRWAWGISPTILQSRTTQPAPRPERYRMTNMPVLGSLGGAGPNRT